MREERIDEKLGDDAGFRDDGVDNIVVVFDCRNETSLDLISEACPDRRLVEGPWGLGCKPG